jgi:hypothetical protein
LGFQSCLNGNCGRDEATRPARVRHYNIEEAPQCE